MQAHTRKYCGIDDDGGGYEDAGDRGGDERDSCNGKRGIITGAWPVCSLFDLKASERATQQQKNDIDTKWILYLLSYY